MRKLHLLLLGTTLSLRRIHRTLLHICQCVGPVLYGCNENSSPVSTSRDFQMRIRRSRSKMGKMDIDYQVLHDAFFKYQTKPKLTSYGDMYHEGKEFEVKLREMKPNMFSQELKEALGMPEGSPPPWLINMQRYGPPPSYPHLKILGLNTPIPAGAKFGYKHGDWVCWK